MSAVLGINLSHDTSACLIKDGVIFAAEEERWTRLKHNSHYNEDYIFPHNAVEYVLNESKTEIKDIKYTVCVSMSAEDVLGDCIKKRKELEKFPNVIYISHHKAHVLSGYYLSPFEEAVGLCIDGGGSLIGLDFNTRERTSGYYCSEKHCTRIYSNLDRIEVLNHNICSLKNSLGLFYLNFAQRCIPKGDEPEGTMMALSAYGSKKEYYDAVKSLISFLPNGKFQIKSPFGSNNDEVYSINENEWAKNNYDKEFEERANLACAVQAVFEDVVVHILNDLYERTHVDNLVFSGGCALNSKLNGIICKKTKFKNVYVPPAPHDGGTAVGAALYAWNYLLNRERIPTPENLSWGPDIGEISDKQIENIPICDLSIKKFDSESICNAVAELIIDDNVIIWARGKMEFGPRALGNRSIIASPINIETKNRLNKIKNRAWYRPFAPSVLYEEFSNYFTGDSDFYMNKVCVIRDNANLSAVSHKNKTARVQLVTEKNDFYGLLDAMRQKGAPPVILNTSLNLKGVPIDKDVEDVIRSFTDLDIDIAVIGNTIISKPLIVRVMDCDYVVRCFSHKKITTVIDLLKTVDEKHTYEAVEIIKLLQDEVEVSLSDFQIILVLYYYVIVCYKQHSDLLRKCIGDNLCKDFDGISRNIVCDPENNIIYFATELFFIRNHSCFLKYNNKKNDFLQYIDLIRNEKIKTIFYELFSYQKDFFSEEE